MVCGRNGKQDFSFLPELVCHAQTWGRFQNIIIRQNISTGSEVNLDQKEVLEPSYCAGERQKYYGSEKMIIKRCIDTRDHVRVNQKKLRLAVICSCPERAYHNDFDRYVMRSVAL